MAVTVNIQKNPLNHIVGTSEADATIINSGLTIEERSRNISLPVQYQIQKRVEGDTLLISSDVVVANYPQVVSVSKIALRVILENRTKYRVRVRGSIEDVFGKWVNFTTRDKRYSTPDAVTQLVDDGDNTAQTNTRIRGRRNRRLVITNKAKAAVTTTAKGATVISTDKVYNSTIDIRKTGRGVNVTNVDPITYHKNGATIDNSRPASEAGS